jgi:hypothetical protein
VLSIINHGRKQRVPRDGTPVDGQFDASQSRQASLHENTNGS